MSCQRGLCVSVLEIGCGGQSAQVPVAVVQLVHGGVCRQMTAVGEEVCTVSLGLDVCREVVERVLGHEVVQVQVLYLDVCIVGHVVGGHVAFGIEGDGGVAFQFHAATAFAGREVCGIFGTVGLDGAVEGDAVGDAVVLRGQQTGGKAQVLCLGTQPDVGLQILEVSQVACRTAGGGVEGCRQVDVQTREVHLSHIAVHGTFDAQWLVGVLAEETLRHVAHEFDHILLADLGVQAHLHLPGILIAEGVQVHIHLCEDVRVGCLHVKGRYLHVAEIGIKSDTSLEVGDFQTRTLVLQGGFPDIEGGACGGVTELVDPQRHVR